jgi:hypothetical protein
MTPSRALLVLLLAVGPVAACGTDDPAAGGGSASEPVALPRGDACGDVWFWAATEAGDLAVTAYVDARSRSGSQASTIDFAVGDAGVRVEVLRGRDLPRNFCTDVIDSRSEPTEAQPAVAGTGRVTLEPLVSPTGCGSIAGELTLEGVVAEDGTELAPIAVSSRHVGCYSG